VFVGTKRQIFYSFHFDNDVMRVQQIRNIGALEENEPVSPNEWEQVKRGGSAAIEKWIDDNMKYRSCVVVLVGAETAQRPWVKHEIKKAWDEKKGLLGIHVHGLNCPRNGLGTRGPNPFEQFTVGTSSLSDFVKCYSPNSQAAYGDIARNLDSWVEAAIAARA
jgi:hypothetical protein